MRSSIKRILPILLILASFSVKYGYAQYTGSPYFKDGDRVCFVGNSITTDGYFHYFINLYYATRFPNARITFYNCGIAGNKAPQILARLDRDVFNWHPTYCVLMVGMNDVNRDLYKSGLTGPNIEKARKDAIIVYRNYVDSLVFRLKSAGKVILLRPSIYDQTSTMPSENLLGVNDALGQCSRIIDSIGAKYRLKVVDFWSLMNTVNREVQKQSPVATIIGKDRIHPGMPGHLVMAYQFIRSTNPIPYVSAITINYSTKHVSCHNCTVKQFNKLTNGDVFFKCTENSLPFPIADGAMVALNWIHFQQELNREPVSIRQMKAGLYDFYIDSTLVGRFSSHQLAAGINLSDYRQTPQYRQAMQVSRQLADRATLQNHLRRGKYAEYNYLIKSGLTDIKDSASVSHYLAAQLKIFKGTDKFSFINDNFESYLKYGLYEQKILAEMGALQNQVYAINKPITHQYRFVKVMPKP